MTSTPPATLIEDAYELQSMSAHERGSLIPRPDSDAEDGEVLYETFQESDGEDSVGVGRRRRTESGGGKKEFFYTVAQERAVVRRLDWCLVSFLSGLYMLSFLDRSSKSSSQPPGWPVLERFLTCCIVG
jgi:hypothetical protein